MSYPDLECPYCDHGIEICHDDGFGYEEDKAHELECDSCGKNFVFYTSISHYFSPVKADRLNGEPHQFSEWRKRYEHDGKIFQSRVCKDCDHNEDRSIPNGKESL